ncbi:AAA family ATPase [Halobacillus litoralis]|uniref:AAA family ATPase n=1 Tax=Halobacillus litoralis TaxID=45668 RepID=UPI0024914779|nr:SMC family ATPase [Halobacillus litoralis]
MRIDQINIENFRCFKGLNKFNIDGKTIIIYGENGYGKSSFFDAIEWCLTGEIDRFKQPGRSLDKKVIANRHVETGEMCSVEMTIDGMKFRRYFRISDNARESIVIKDLSDNTIAQGKENVEKYIEENIAYKTTNKKLLTALIKRSHLLAQDQITDFVLRDDPKERFNSLANIMGYRQLMNMAKNLNKVKNNVNQYISELKKDISTYNHIIDEKQKEKLEFDLVEFNNTLNKIGINFDQEREKFVSEIKKKEEVLLNKKSKLDHKFSQIQKVYSTIKNLSYNKLNTFVTQLHKEIQSDQEKVKRIDRLIERINDKNKNIAKKLTNIDAQNNIFIEKGELEKKIKKLESEIKDTDILEKDIEELLQKNEYHQNELFYAQTHMGSYLSDQKKIKDNLYAIEVNELYIEKCKRRISRYNKYLSIFKSLLDNEKESTSLAKLNDAIREVYKYVEHNNTDQVCPVCSSEKEDLSQTILDNIETNLYFIQKKSSKIAKANEIVKRITNKIDELNNTKIKIENDLKNSRTNLDIASNNIVRIKKNNLFNNQLFEMSYEKVTNKIEVSSEKINEYNSLKIKYHTLKTLNDKLKEYPRKRHGEDLRMENHLESRLLTLSSRKDFLVNNKKNVEKKMEDDKEKHEKNNQLLVLLTNTLSIDQRHVPIESVSNGISNELNEITSQIELLRGAYDTYQKLLNNSKVESTIKDYTEVTSQKTKQIEDYKHECEYINNYRKSIYDQIGDKASDLLNKSNSKIQKYFRYLNPVPNVSEVLFDSSQSPEELEIVLSYKNKSDRSTNTINVQHSLSSGQLYVLAISVFLAINEEQNVSKLDFIGIDDPIQNMDDVNQFSVCDVLSTIERQLIFSTHDWDFLKLYLKKNEYKKDSIQVFLLENKDSLVTNVKDITFSE